MKFFINSNNSAYLRMLEEEFQESTNAIRVELNRFEKAKMLLSSVVGNKKLYKANTSHPLFLDIKKIVLKHVGIDNILENVANKLGHLQKVYLTGSFVKGLNSDTITLVFIGNIDEDYLQKIIAKTQTLIHKNIQYEVLQSELEKDEFVNDNKNYMLLWSNA